jgi:hypothetical protein
MNYYNYFTEIEEHFVRRRGKHLYISPLDWSLIATWRDTGIPLHVALRGIDKAMDSFFAKFRANKKVNTLFYCHNEVMTEYAGFIESRVGEEAPARESEGTPVSGQAVTAQAKGSPAPESVNEGPDRQSVLRFFVSRISEIKALRAKHLEESPLHEGIERILSRLEEIKNDIEQSAPLEFESIERDLAILDESLVTLLRSTLPPERSAAWQEEAKKELKVYKKRLPKETYGKILENFLRGKIHRHWNVGELSLFHL